MGLRPPSWRPPTHKGSVWTQAGGWSPALRSSVPPDSASLLQIQRCSSLQRALHCVFSLSQRPLASFSLACGPNLIHSENRPRSSSRRDDASAGDRGESTAADRRSSDVGVIGGHPGAAAVVDDMDLVRSIDGRNRLARPAVPAREKGGGDRRSTCKCTAGPGGPGKRSICTSHR
jgi:hypothetical protein